MEMPIPVPIATYAAMHIGHLGINAKIIEGRSHPINPIACLDCLPEHMLLGSRLQKLHAFIKQPPNPHLRAKRCCLNSQSQSNTPLLFAAHAPPMDQQIVNRHTDHDDAPTPYREHHLHRDP